MGIVRDTGEEAHVLVSDSLHDVPDVGDFVVDALDAFHQPSKLFPDSSAVGPPGVLEFFAQVEAAQVGLPHLIQLENQDDVSRKVEVVFHLARLQVGSENPNTEFL